MKNTIFSTLLCMYFFRSGDGGNVEFRDIIPETYDYLHPPFSNLTDPVEVEINIVKISVRSIDESDMSFSVTIELWQNWSDNRLQYPYWAKGPFQVLDSAWTVKLWNPKLYFINAVDGKLDNIISPSSFYWITRELKIFFCCRVVLKLICEMDLRRFPHDDQICGIQMGSAIYNTEEMVLDWRDPRREVQLFSLQQFVITGLNKTSFLKPLGTHQVSCLELQILLRRRTGYYLINVYIPTILIVIMSMLTFWIPHDAVPARITLGVTSLLTMITKQYQSSMPSVSYVVALNVWLSCCIGFVFFSLLEFAAVIALSVHAKKDGQNPSNLSLPTVVLRTNKTWTAHNTWDQKSFQGEKKGPTRLDYFSRISFPVSFTVFCIVYWTHYN